MTTLAHDQVWIGFVLNRCQVVVSRTVAIIIGAIAGLILRGLLKPAIV
jgi:hypothetical protein